MTRIVRVRRTGPLAGLALAAGLGLLAAGCGGGSKASVSTTPAQTTAAAPSGSVATVSRALFTYAACMRKSGVAIPDPIRGADGRYAFPKIPASVLNAPGVRQRAQSCAAKLPRGSFRRGPASAVQRAAFQKFSACMRTQGVSFGALVGRPFGQSRTPGAGPSAAPPAGGSQGTRPGGGFFNSTDPKVRAALAKCRALLPARFGPPTSKTGAG